MNIKRPALKKMPMIFRIVVKSNHGRIVVKCDSGRLIVLMRGFFKKPMQNPKLAQGQPYTACYMCIMYALVG